MDAAGHVLVVEDDPITARVHRAILEHEGYAVTIAESGEQAVEQAAHAHPNAILMDIGLPGMDGLEVARELGRSPDTRCIPIVMITSARSFPVGAGMDEIGNVLRFLYKPVPERVLVPAMQEAVQHGEQGDP